MKDTIKAGLALLLMAGVMLLAIFIFQSWFHPYETDCQRIAEGVKCAIKYHTYWQPTLNI